MVKLDKDIFTKNKLKKLEKRIGTIWEANTKAELAVANVSDKLAELYEFVWKEEGLKNV